MIQKNLHLSALKIAMLFLVMGLLWIFVSQGFLLDYIADIDKFSSLLYYKDVAFIVAATIVIFLLVNRQLASKDKQIEFIHSQREWQQILIKNLPNIDVYLLDTQFDLIFKDNKNTAEKLNSALKIVLKSNDLFSVEGNKNITLRDYLPKMIKGNKIVVAVVKGNEFLEIQGVPIKDEKGTTNGLLLIIFNRSAQRELIQQISDDKQSFAMLSEKYHRLNSELAESYKQMKTYNNELLENKERYGAFIQQTTEAVYRFDLKKAIDLTLPPNIQVAALISTSYLAEYNAAFANIYGFESDKNYVGKNINEIFGRRNEVQNQEILNELTQNSCSLQAYESIESDKNGRTRYFLNNIVGIVEDNKLHRIWGTKHETTKQKKHERELILAKKEAEKSNRLKTAFLANMSHEIRTPLNGILGFSELLIKPSIVAEKKNKYFNIIQSSSQQLLRIINDILDISRIQTGELSITKTEFGVNTLLSEIESSLYHDIEQKKSTVDFIVNYKLEKGMDRIFTDRDRLYQIVTNLANNALKFTHKGSVTVSYEVKSPSVMEFSVTDTGIGIPDEYLGDIFDQFRQVEEFSSRKYGGTGLGLSICKGLVELLGGYISVASEEDAGSTFKFTIKTAE